MASDRLPLLERAIASVAPAVAARRARARLQLEGLTTAREGLRYAAGGHDSRTQGWYTPHTDAAAAAEGKLHTIRARHRDMVRDNPFAARAVQVIVDATVGTGARPQAVSENREEAERAEAYFRRWASSPACDADGCNDFAGLQALAMRTIVESGGVLTRRRLRTREEDTAALPVPLQVQLLEPDHLSEVKRQNGGNAVVQGVEFDPIGRRVAYWLTQRHPGAAYSGLAAGALESLEGRRVLASEVIHAFRMDRPGQVQGVPWGAPAMLTLRELDNYTDAELVRKRLAACFTAFVVGADAPGPSSVGTGKRAESLEPGVIQYLRDGESVDFAVPNDSPTYDAFVGNVLRAVSVGYGVPYAALTGDLTKVNFSSGRIGGMDFWRSVETWRSRVLVQQFLAPIWRWVQEVGVAAGELQRVLPATWTAPGRTLVDPRAEGEADHTAIRNGTKTLVQVIQERGRDPEEHLREIQRGNALLDELGLTLDSDPRRAPAPGTSAGAQGGKGEKPEDEDPEEPDEDQDEGDDDGEGGEEEARGIRRLGA